jgi:hypothetical protein
VQRVAAAVAATKARQARDEAKRIKVGGCRGNRCFEILCETAVSAEPCQEALNDPASGMDGEADLISTMILVALATRWAA